MKYFLSSIVLAIICLGVAFYKGGTEALFICAVLSVMEVSLSFDNAVVNAGVLKGMNAFWRKMFMTLGMFIAVFGMRLVLPIIIVALASGTGCLDTMNMAFNNPEKYAHALHDCEINIASFGGMFLLLVFLSFVFDYEKEHHWITPIEKHLAKIGKLDTASVVVSIISLLVYVQYVPVEKKMSAMISGVIGIACFLLLDGIKSLTEDSSAAEVGTTVVKNGLIGFIYLEVLDASFSLDGVVGAFALSKSVLIIMLGLCIGAMFVRSLTIYMVEKNTLDQYVYLEHGAMWAIGALAAMMLIGSTAIHIPEWVTGLTGAALIGASVASSIYEKRKLGTKPA